MKLKAAALVSNDGVNGSASLLRSVDLNGPELALSL